MKKKNGKWKSCAAWPWNIAKEQISNSKYQIINCIFLPLLRVLRFLSRGSCYTFYGSLEWVGRLLAPMNHVLHLITKVGDRRLRCERKVRTPQGNGLANGQAG